MAGKDLSDKQGKDVLRLWPERPGPTLFPGGPWVRAQPPVKGTTSPRLMRPATTAFSPYTQPDGLWLALLADATGPVATSVFAVEVCRTLTNLADKRSRYAPGHAALTVHLPKSWLQGTINVQNKGIKPRWTLFGGTIMAVPTVDLRLPVRSIRILFALPNHLYSSHATRLALEAHEYLISHSKVGHTNAAVRSIVGQALASHIA